LLVVARLLGLAQPPFEFTLYQYGPYSFSLDSTFAQMELYGYLVRTFPREGYGPKYQVTDLGREEVHKLDPAAASTLDRIAHAFGSRDSQSLELVATALWVERQEQVHRDEAIVERVLKLKPRFDRARVEAALRHSHELVRELAPSVLGSASDMR
jgi:hypothetical protein